MDIAAIAKDVVTFLAPFLPYLVKAGERASEEAGKEFGAEAIEKARALWSKLRGEEEVEDAAQDAAAMPNDPDARAALRLKLKKLLIQDKTLAQELAQVMQAGPQVSSSTEIRQRAGNNAFQIGQARDVEIKR